MTRLFHFQNMESQTKEFFQLPELVDFADYEDQKLSIQGKRVFEKTEKFGRMALIANSET